MLDGLDWGANDEVLNLGDLFVLSRVTWFWQERRSSGLMRWEDICS